MPPRFPPPRRSSHIVDPCPNGPITIVICGPSGCGKTTLVKRLIAEFGDFLERSVSHTSRQPRDKEEDGIDYYFLSKTSILDGIENGEYLEFASYVDQIYGTSRSVVEGILQSGKHCLLTIDVEGVKQLKSSDFPALYLFVRPPNLQTLEGRLRTRNRMNEEELQRRLDRAVHELTYSREPGNFDEIFVNDDLELCYAELSDYLQSYITSLKSKLPHGGGQA